MTDWAGYALADFLMFAPDTYVRQFALLNAALWPLHVVLYLLAGAAAWRLRPAVSQDAAVLWLLVPAWAACAWWFLHQRYAPISLAGDPWTGLFALQALLLAAVAARPALRLVTPRTRLPGMLLIGYALLVHPLLGLPAGRDAAALEWFGLAPDPTALATLGVLLTLRGLPAALLALVPLAWCLFSGLSYLAMAMPLGTLAPLAAIAAAVARYLLGRTAPATGAS
ncbi:MAG: DUF6064 family protein [Gammaproteobacteria bacterium]|nr:DUF6064 family protein [Gammaproteobacteria bacterium]